MRTLERPDLAAAVEAFITTSPNLALAADYCNTFKHAGLDRPTRSGKAIQRINQHSRLDMTPRGFVASARLEVTVDGVPMDALTLAKDCVAEWDGFLQRHGIIVQR
jgi:hypothetical protein